MQRFAPWFFFIPLLLAMTESLKGQVDLYSMAKSTISGSVKIKPGHYMVNTSSLGEHPWITIQGDHIEIDFNHAVIDGRAKGQLPDDYSGIAVHIKDSRNVTIKNVSIHGFKIAILAENVENLNILSCDLSYNYKPRLYSRWDREALSDWLYYHNNEQDEWKRYGAAIYLKQCTGAVVRNILCHQGMNGLLMVRCRNSLVYNNDIRFNSGLGIGLYRSRDNRIMHNKLDWNARGYSHGQYARGQDSSAILLYEQSSGNVIAYNSGTHSGDGLFLWSGQSTMDTGLGGCDSNMIFRNDFSHSIANGIEATFSANYMIENVLNDCRYGVWGGYSHHSMIRDNEIKDCEAGIAIEHGRYIRIEGNDIAHCGSGIRLWDRPSQPSDWPYAQKLDVSGRQYLLERNRISHVATAFDISGTDSVMMQDNTVEHAKNDSASDRDPSPLFMEKVQQPWMNMMAELPAPLPDGMQTFLPEGTLRGLKYILVDEWGPYDFQSPTLALRKKEENDGYETLHFDIYGPPGKWRMESVRGCRMPDHITGRVPDSMTVRCHLDSASRQIQLIYLGQQVITPVGDTLAEGTLYPFGYAAFSVATNWTVAFFAFDSLSDPMQAPASFQSVLQTTPLETRQANQLAYRWWGKPGPDLPADQFAIRASSDIFTDAGDYVLEVESDDGIRVWLDDTLMLERWDIHTPVMDRIPFRASQGRHEMKVEYFEAAGLAVLDVMVRPQPAESTR